MTVTTSSPNWIGQQQPSSSRSSKFATLGWGTQSTCDTETHSRISLAAHRSRHTNNLLADSNPECVHNIPSSVCRPLRHCWPHPHGRFIPYATLSRTLSIALGAEISCTLQYGGINEKNPHIDAHPCKWLSCVVRAIAAYFTSALRRLFAAFLIAAW